MKNTKTIGLIGGMGPLASSYFYDLLIKKSERNFGAKNNDDYPRIIIDSLPVLDFISDTKNLDTARGMLIDSIKKMNSFGVSCVAMVCNTAHVLYKDLQKQSATEFVSMIDLTAERAKKLNFKKVGVLASPTTLKSKLYKKALLKRGIISIDIDHNSRTERIIREVVAGKINKSQSDYLYKLTNRFIKKYELDAVILGCTELPLVFPKNRFKNVIDCLDILADELLRRYYV